MTTRVGSAFVPVSDAAAAAGWYADYLDLQAVSVEPQVAVLTDDSGSTVTLLAPSSGIAAKPGLDWATCNYVVSDLDGQHAESERRGLAPSAVEGDATVCRFFTVRDLDGNLMLIVDR
ncbi:MAG TPA: VOC family protein [Kribbella sp.]|jgi:catechol 2,3-dioxygenase-like lactoylglutathione lyase family enzyme